MIEFNENTKKDFENAVVRIEAHAFFKELESKFIPPGMRDKVQYYRGNIANYYMDEPSEDIRIQDTRMALINSFGKLNEVWISEFLEQVFLRDSEWGAYTVTEEDTQWMLKALEIETLEEMESVIWDAMYNLESAWENKFSYEDVEVKIDIRKPVHSVFFEVRE